MELFIAGIVAVFGAVIGSFLNVVILRLPEEGASIVYPASHCPQCKTPIQWYDNIPILSYCMLLGKCRNCSERISIQYPLVEACMALLAAATFLQFGLGFDFFYYLFFVACLLVIIFIDIHHQIIPDVISLPGIAIGVAGSFFSQNITWQQSVFGVLFGGGILFLVSFVYFKIARQDGMGGGDVKLLGMLGAFLGWPSLLFIIFFSSLTGSIVGIAAMVKQKKGGKTRIPYGPFLAVAGYLFLFYQDRIYQIWQMYLQALGKY
ncbi:prepilin peptidase [Desulfogranum japonicum]|uniref:prepilin peptidase n=1 Tax=Desulfogranum japonicum TaxID=231447 RepID=UPI0004109DD0|nr:A24 family peptidase [Desulfogranum japonicum]